MLRELPPESLSTQSLFYKTMAFKKGHIPWNNGKKGVYAHSKETKRKIGLGGIGRPPWNKGKKLSKKIRMNMSRAQTGMVTSKGTKRKIGNANRGKKRSKEIRRRMCGENHWNWRGGVSFDPYPKDWTNLFKESIRQRDSYICQLCGVHQDELSRVLDVHHIDYDKYNLDPENLVALCRSCHQKTNLDRECWIEFFT